MSFARLPIPQTRQEMDNLPLSYAQERQWFLWQLEPESSAYHIPTALRLRGRLDIASLQRSFAALVERHESLRTRIARMGDEWVQVVSADVSLALEVEVQRGLDEQRLLERVEAEVARPFDLEQGPLLRVTLLEVDADEHVLVMVQHHIVSDGWSMQLMVEELVQLYAAYSQGLDVGLPALPIQYADYALWQRSWMEAGEKERQLAYWTGLLGGEQPVIELPLDHPRQPLRSYRGAQLDLELEPHLALALKQLVQRKGVTMFMLLLASFQALLHRYSGQADIRVGVPIANRNRVETERLIGFFVNTQVLKADINGRMGFDELLAQARQRALEAQAHQDLPFEQLVEALQPERSLGHNPLFQVMFNHQADSRSANQGVQLPGLSLERMEWRSSSVAFDLTLDVHEAEDGIWASFGYATDLFEASTVERLARHWQNLLRGIVAEPGRPVAELPLLLDEERDCLLRAWAENADEGGLPPLVQLQIQEQARLRPQAQALALEGQALSYAELNARANRLAHCLIARGVGPDVLVGIAVERSLDMVIGLLAILKAGGAYVPLDPTYPQDRLRHMLEDSAVGLLLSQEHLLPGLPLHEGLEVLSIDRLERDVSVSTDDPVVNLRPENLAYVIYTSGSTGKPKGVAISHAALAQFSRIASGYSALTPEDRILQFATLSFDGFVEQLYPALTRGACVVLRGGDLWDTGELYRQIVEQGVTLADLPTAYWNLFLLDALAEPRRSYGALRQIHIGGEAMPLEGPKLWRQAGMGRVRLLNTYGPTEATVVSSVFDCSAENARVGNASPIGQALPGRTLLVLDEHLGLLPVGAVGELYIASRAGLARAYHDRPGLTAERFLPDPFGEPGSRLYRTGDLARRRGDGVIEYMGRADHQVKIRGFRIELGEVEARLLDLEGIREAAALALDGQLVAYLVAEGGEDETRQPALRERIRTALRASLPDYMVPSHLLFLERMPLSPNGKLDRRALPKPDAGLTQRDHMAPASALEKDVAAIWGELLGVERVGLTDNFFELGGHSLLATRLVSRIRQDLGIEVSLKSLFEQPVLQGFVESLGEKPAEVPPIMPVTREQPLPLSYAQERQWFLWQLEPESAAYHIPAALRLRGGLDVVALQRSFERLAQRHESLRTRFRQEGLRTVQVVDADGQLQVSRHNLANVDDASLRAAVEAEMARPFDLRTDALLRISLFEVAPNDHVLVMVQHHIVSDGWSMQLMVEELVQLYAAYSQGREAALPALPIQYPDYAVWQREWMEAGERERQLAYWIGLLGGEQPVLELPFDRPRPAEQSFRGARLEFELGAERARRLKALAQRQGASTFMLLLASFQALLYRYSGQSDIRVGVPVANRNRVETERLIGFFVNTQVLKADIDGQMGFDRLLHQVRQRSLEAQAHQDLPFEQLVEALQPERSLSHSPLFQVLFNYQAERGEHGLPEVAGLSIEEQAWESHTAQFDLVLDTCESESDIWAALVYATDLFDASTAERLVRHWQNLLDAILAMPDARLGELDMLDREEREVIGQLWNRSDSGYPATPLVHQRVAERARMAPDAVAVIFDEEKLTYAELDSRANRLAHALIARGVGPEVRVAIAMQRSAEIMVAFLAVLKAGGAYVPLDIEYPRERLLYMMQDSRAHLLLTHSHLLERLPIPEGLSCLSVDREEEWAGFPAHDPEVALHGDNLAYVIYTSGSTGMPKGVAVSHGPLIAHIVATGERYEMTPEDCELHFMSFAFDGSHEGWMHPLINGARVLIRDDSLWLPERTYAEMHRHGVTVGVFPPVYLQQLAEHAERDGNPPPVRVYCFGGDAVAQASYDLAWRALKPKYLFNGYGPTETVVTPLLWKARAGDACGAAYMPIGTLLGNRSGYILDGQLNLLPVGVAGELYLGGEGVARGYLERPALTAERFVPDPFGAPGSRLYRSGDLTRGRADGVVDYLGRVDHQVKIRGFRIELGEIEARLREHPAVREAVVVAQPGAVGQQLVGYVVAQEPAVADSPEAQAECRAQLKTALRERLPEYMVPSHLLFLARMPLTPNGKLDRKGLPQPDASLLQQVYVAPRSDLEQQVAGIWAEVLQLQQVGLDDNFFELGGHSLLATQVIGRLRERLHLEVPIKSMFTAETLGEFCHGVETLKAESAPVEDALAKSLEALKRLSADELEKLIS
ncbi:non-ribosomal peptide synthetase [Pseudomonas aeruginosa]|uniref:non-ribosomal peptide synthetase n=3 Tax=Pseudomonas aeruginosa TaxID=287 RepID=UPI00125E9D55|nr:non-ribosomal peptide synthetase [Pseudomonas aeruginosa]KAB5408721.1 amino acid adenylation domain-containing protein [Pseudomonas aeruginosa]